MCSTSAPEESGADLNAMFADVNSLPANDPLRAQAEARPVVGAASAEQAAKPEPKRRRR